MKFFLFIYYFRCIMEIFNNLDAIEQLNAVPDVEPPPAAPIRQPVHRRPRSDPFQLPDAEFRSHYRFNKATVRQLAELLQLQDRPNRHVNFLIFLTIVFLYLLI